MNDERTSWPPEHGANRQTADLARTVRLGEAAADTLRDEAATARRAVVAKPDRSYVWVAAGVCSVVMAVVSIVVSTNASREAAQLRAEAALLRAESAQQGAIGRQSRALAQQAYTAAQAAQRVLVKRGQEPVPLPLPSEAAPADVIASAAAAKVLAELPKLRPSAEDLGGAVARYITSHPQGPTAATLSALIASYLRDSAPGSGPRGASGRDGRDGQPGPAPTQEQIMTAVNTHCAQQPGGTCEGASGKDGRDGKDGQPPATWVWTQPMPVPPGTVQTCTRDGGPDDAPTYQCVAE